MTSLQPVFAALAKPRHGHFSCFCWPPSCDHLVKKKMVKFAQLQVTAGIVQCRCAVREVRAYHEPASTFTRLLNLQEPSVASERESTRFPSVVPLSSQPIPQQSYLRRVMACSQQG